MKTSKMSVMAQAVGLLAVSSVWATDYEWVNASDRSSAWETTANWTVGGEAATAYPCLAEDAAVVPSALSFVQTLLLNCDVWTSGANLTLGALSGGAGTQVAFNGRDGQITIANPNGYTGVFRMNQARDILNTTSAAETTPTFHAVDVRDWTKINNLGTAGKVVLESAFGEGRLSLNGAYNDKDYESVASTIEVRETGGIAQEAKVHKGTAIFAGAADKDAAGAIAPAPWMHLDASAASSISLDENGKVVRWNDVRGNGVWAGVYQPDWATKPFNAPKVRANWANGLPAVDFGLYAGTKANAEPGTSYYCRSEWTSNNRLVGDPAALAWSERRTDVKEAFFVFSDSSNTNMGTGVKTCSPFIVGDPTTASFSRGDLGTLFYDSVKFDSRGVVCGDVRVNGKRVSYDHAENYACRPYVVSVRGATDLVGSLFAASGRQCDNAVRDLHLGGILLGEVLVYTNALTDAQRAATERFLMAKWLDADGRERARADLGLLDLSAADVAAEFTGGTFTAAEMLLPEGGGTFTKKGDGALEVGKMTPACTAVRVEGGSLAFRQRLNPKPDATRGPAADPQVWLDATQADSFVYDGGNLVQWKDWRTDGARKRAYATSYFDVVQTYPTRNVDDPAHPYVDFGAYWKSADFQGAAQKLADYDGVTLEAFVVYRNHAGMTTCHPFAGDYIVGSDGADQLQAEWYSGADALSATFRQNGVTLNTQGAKIPAGSGESFAVYSCRFPAGFSLNYLACDRGGRGGLGEGGCDIAEVLYYDRRLTDGERRDVEAYLMKKWLGREHPDATRLTQLASVVFADGVKGEVSSDEPLAIASVAGAGELVKKGTGATTIGSASGFTGLAVEEGTLAATTDDMFGDAYFHVDASDAASLVYVDGTEKGEIAQWKDVRGNGRYAQAMVTDLGNNEQYLKYPRMNAAAGPGWAAGKPTVDFLTFARPRANIYSFTYEETECAAMRWVDENGATTGSKDVREVHVVYCENGLDCSMVTNGTWIGFYGYGSSIGQQFLRDGMYRLFSKSYSPIAYDSAMRIDGEEITCDTYVASSAANKHFHVLSMAAADSLHANCFCNDRGNCGAGGYRLAEVVVFTGATNNYAKFKAINDYLCKKWRDIGEGGSYSRLASLRATGGALDVAAATGTVAPADGATLDFAFRDADDYGRIDVDGVFAFPASGTLRVDMPKPGKGDAKPTMGEYVLLKADSFAGVENFANWTIALDTGARYRAKVRLDADKGELVLVVYDRGTTLIVR